MSSMLHPIGSSLERQYNLELLTVLTFSQASDKGNVNGANNVKFDWGNINDVNNVKSNWGLFGKGPV